MTIEVTRLPGGSYSILLVGSGVTTVMTTAGFRDAFPGCHDIMTESKPQRVFKFDIEQNGIWAEPSKPRRDRSPSRKPQRT